MAFSGLTQALQFIKNTPNAVQGLITDNIVNPIKRASPEYKKNVQSGQLFAQLKPIYDRMTPRDVQNFKNPTVSNYTYSGVLKSNPDPVVRINSISPTPMAKKIPVKTIAQAPVISKRPTRVATATPSPSPQITWIRKPTATPTPSPTAMPSPTPQFEPGSFESIAYPIFQKYGIPPEVGFAMAQAEGGNIGSYNVYNLGAFDSNPNNAFNYSDASAGIEAFAKLLADPNGRYAKAYALRNDPVAMMKAISDAGYAGDPKTWKQRSISQGGAGKYHDTYPDFVMNTSAWKKHAKPSPKPSGRVKISKKK